MSARSEVGRVPVEHFKIGLANEWPIFNGFSRISRLFTPRWNESYIQTVDVIIYNIIIILRSKYSPNCVDEVHLLLAPALKYMKPLRRGLFTRCNEYTIIILYRGAANRTRVTPGIYCYCCYFASREHRTRPPVCVSLGTVVCVK